MNDAYRTATEAALARGPHGSLFQSLQELAQKRGLVLRLLRNNSGSYRKFGNCHVAIHEAKHPQDTRDGHQWHNCLWWLGGGVNAEATTRNSRIYRILCEAARELLAHC